MSFDRLAPLALTVGPLAAYFAAQGAWYASGRPRVASGTLDYFAMALGLGALLAYGPAGDAVLEAIFKAPGSSARLAWLSLLTLIALLRAGPSHRRLLLYNVEPPGVLPVLRAVLERTPGEFTSTLRGFEDRAAGRILTVRTSRPFRSAELSATGPGAERLIRDLEGALRLRLAREPRRTPWRIAILWFALSASTLAVPAAWLTLGLPGPDRPASP